MKSFKRQCVGWEKLATTTTASGMEDNTHRAPSGTMNIHMCNANR